MTMMDTRSQVKGASWLPRLQRQRLEWDQMETSTSMAYNADDGG